MYVVRMGYVFYLEVSILYIMLEEVYSDYCVPAKKAWNEGKGKVMVFLADETMYDKIPHGSS